MIEPLSHQKMNSIYDNAGPYNTPYPRSQIQAYVGNAQRLMTLMPPVQRVQADPTMTRPNNYRGAYHIPGQRYGPFDGIVVPPHIGRFSQPKFPGFPKPIQAFASYNSHAPRIYQQ